MVNTSTFLSDTVKFIRNGLSSNITDPISSTRGSVSRFIATSYPQRDVQYPMITIKGIVEKTIPLGMRSQQLQIFLRLEIRVWARNVVEKDKLSEQIIDYLRSHQLGTSSTTDTGLFGFDVTSMNVIDENGEGAPKSKIITIKYSFLCE